MSYEVKCPNCSIVKFVSMISVDVLIPCHNEEKYLPALCESLNKLKIPQNIKVSFVFSDNASTDGTSEYLKKIDLKNKKIYSHNQNIGGTSNLIFLLSVIQSDYFMYLDAHDFLTENYFYKFSLLLTNSKVCNIFIGDVVTLKEGDTKFEICGVQERFNFLQNPILRQLQLALFLYHNSIYHSIICKEMVDIAFLAASKTLTFDHVITHAALAKCNLVYLDGSYYVRRYRRIHGSDFTHDVNGQKISRYQRAAGPTSNLDNNQLHRIIGRINLQIGNKFFSHFISFLIKGKFFMFTFNFVIFRVLRFGCSKLSDLNPIYNEKRKLSKCVSDEIYKNEILNVQDFRS